MNCRGREDEDEEGREKTGDWFGESGVGDGAVNRDEEDVGRWSYS